MKMAELALLALLALTVTFVSAEESCFAVNPGSIAEVCSRMQDKLQLAVVRNPVNIYLIKKAFSEPVPSIVNVVYDVNILNKSTTACALGQSEPANISMTFHDALWTDRGIFTLIHPGILQQLQLQFPYVIARFAKDCVGTDNPFGSFVLSAILWNGCKSTTSPALPNITLSLQIDYLPCTPSKFQLETSLLELTTWLQAFVNLQPQNEQPELDIINRKFVLSSEFTVRSCFVVPVVQILASPAYFCMLLAIYVGIKQFIVQSAERYRRITKRVFTPVLLVTTSWNVLIIAGDIISFVTCPPRIDNNQPYNIMLLLSTSFLFPLLCVIFNRKIQSQSENLQAKIFTNHDICKKTHLIYAFALWNLFMFVAYFSSSVIAALLLAYAYPFEVVSVSLYLIISVVFNVLLFSIIFHTAYSYFCELPVYLLNVPYLHKLYFYSQDHSSFRQKIKVMYHLVGIFIHILVVLVMNIVLLSIFGVAVLRGLVSFADFTGKFVSFLPSIVLAAVSWPLKRHLIKSIYRDEETAAIVPRDVMILENLENGELMTGL